MSELKEAIKRLSKTNTGFDAILELATVKSVNETEMTCSVALFDNEDLVLDGVKLKPVVPGVDVSAMGAVLYPAVGSKVIIGQINNSDTDLFVVLASKVSKIALDAGSSFKMLLDLQNGSMAFDLAKMVFNKGNNGGLPLIKPLLSKLNQLENKVNNLVDDYKAHKHAGVATGGGISGIPDKQNTTKIQSITKLEEIENKAIQQ